MPRSVLVVARSPVWSVDAVGNPGRDVMPMNSDGDSNTVDERGGRVFVDSSMDAYTLVRWAGLVDDSRAKIIGQGDFWEFRVRNV